MSSDLPPERNTPICQFFAQKQCRRGRFCRFLHVIDISADRAKRENAAVNENHFGGVEESSTEKKPCGISKTSEDGKSSVRKRCREFFGRGYCRFGDNCKFSHEEATSEESKLEVRQRRNRNKNTKKNLPSSDPAQHHDAAVQPSDEAVNYDTNSDHKENTLPPPKPTPKKPCRFFRAGYCRLGNSCNFLHPENAAASGGRRRGGALKRENERESKSSLIEGNGGGKTEKVVGKEGNEADRYVKQSLPASSRPAQGYAAARAEPRQLQFADAASARKNELEQAHKRFPGAEEKKAEDGSVTLKFVFSPTDPDWPYDVKAINIEATFPIEYPTEMLRVQVSDDGQMPETVRRLVSESMQEWVQARYLGMRSCAKPPSTPSTESSCPRNEPLGSPGGEFDLAFRPLLKWFDKQAEQIFTAALKQYKREMMAAAAGLEFIPASQLRKVYTGADAPPAAKASSTEASSAAPDNPPHNAPAPLPSHDKSPDCSAWTQASSQAFTPGGSHVESLDPLDSSNPHAPQAHGDKSDLAEVPGSADLPAVQSTAVGAVGATGRVQPARCGTEVTLQSLALGEGVATLEASRVTLVLACARCSQTCEVVTPAGRVNSIGCAYCHAQMIARFNACIAHHMSNVIGYADLEGCAVVDMVMTSSAFTVVCLGCDKEMKIEALAAGQLNTSWCLHCHQKLNVSANSVRFVKLAAPSATPCDASGACVVETKRPVKAVRDPLIQEGKPLPDFGTCKHFKKSFRWLRFPCCGKAYPCDLCHDDKEGHEMKFANRMICGHCAKEQPYSKEGQCVGCQSSMTSKATAYWEGGTGCRDKIRMSRNDSKKYANVAKTVSRSADTKVDPSKKITRLRHAV